MASVKRFPTHGQRGTCQVEKRQGGEGEIAQALVSIARNASKELLRQARRALAGLGVVGMIVGAASHQRCAAQDPESTAPEYAAPQNSAPVNTAPEYSAGSRLDSATFAQFLALASQNDVAVTDEGTTVDKGTNVQDAAANDLSQEKVSTDRTASEIQGADEEETLTLADVVASLYRAYPEILQARQLGAIASGELLSANGAYDTKLYTESLSEPTGFYQNYRNGLGVARQTWWGGYLSAGYRIGRGFFQPWYKERQTDDAGEFKIGIGQPLLQGRAIDPQRVAVFRSTLERQAAEPRIRKAILEASREASFVYWEWVSAGAILVAEKEQLNLAKERGEQYEVGLDAGKFAEIDVILNKQLIAERTAASLKAEQKFRATGFKLGLFLRDPAGQPMVPANDWLPTRFPLISPPQDIPIADATSAAISRRPETAILGIELRQTQLDRRLACNEMLPRLDFIAEASQDIGEPASKSDDKGEFELVIGFQSELPIQRRKARGKIQSTNAKIVQINEKLRLTRDKIATEIQTAINQLELTTEIVKQNEQSLVAALDSLQRYRYAFEKGKIDLIYLNLLEVKANETKIKLVEAQRDWFSALAELQLALGLDPLDQAMKLSTMVESDLPGPGHLPEILPPADADFERDWQRHNRPQQ